MNFLLQLSLITFLAIAVLGGNSLYNGNATLQKNLSEDIEGEIVYEDNLNVDEIKEIVAKKEYNIKNSYKQWGVNLDIKENITDGITISFLEKDPSTLIESLSGFKTVTINLNKTSFVNVKEEERMLLLNNNRLKRISGVAGVADIDFNEKNSNNAFYSTFIIENCNKINISGTGNISLKVSEPSFFKIEKKEDVFIDGMIPIQKGYNNEEYNKFIIPENTLQTL